MKKNEYNFDERYAQAGLTPAPEPIYYDPNTFGRRLMEQSPVKRYSVSYADKTQTYDDLASEREKKSKSTYSGAR